MGIIDPKPKDHPLLSDNKLMPTTTLGPKLAGVVQAGTNENDIEAGGEMPEVQNGFPDGYGKTN